MLSRLLTLAFSCFVALGIIAIVAIRSGALSFDTLVDRSADLDAVPLATADTAAADVRPTSLKGPTAYAARGRLIDVSERQFDRLASRGLVLVKFGADWCGPCRRVVPELEHLAADNATLTVLTVDVDKQKRLANRYQIGSIPRMILFRDGKQLDSWTGFESASDMQVIIDRAKASAPKGQVQSNPFL